MPHIEHELTNVAAPDKPHLGILTDDSGDITAIPPGATVFIIENPKRLDKITPLILLGVSLKKLTFGCRCGDPHCTVRYEFVASRRGHHNPPVRHDKESLTK